MVNDFEFEKRMAEVREEVKQLCIEMDLPISPIGIETASRAIMNLISSEKENSKNSGLDDFEFEKRMIVAREGLKQWFIEGDLPPTRTGLEAAARVQVLDEDPLTAVRNAKLYLKNRKGEINNEIAPQGDYWEEEAIETIKSKERGWNQSKKIIVQQHIHIGDKIGTLVKDSVVQRSTVGASVRKCPNCGREVEANEKFCLECGAKLLE